MPNQKKKSGVAIGKWLRLILTFGFPMVFVFLFRVVPYARHPEKTPLEKRYETVRGLALDLSKKLHLDARIEGWENVRNLTGSNLIVANHLSVMDIVFLLALAEKPVTFIAKKEVYSTPFVGKCLRAIDGYFLDRDDPKQAVRLFMQAGKLMREKGASVVVYPEGTRLKEPFEKTQEFHAGSFKLVEWGKANLIRVAEFGTFRPLGKGEKAKSFPIEFKAFEPVSYEANKGRSTQEIAEESYSLIAEQVASFQAFDKEFYAEGLYAKKAKEWWK